jgi:glycosyltransferase involved in cell wall biosynthesis
LKDIKKKSIVICSNYAWTIFNFRLPLLKKLRSQGYKIIVLTQFDGYEKKISDQVDEIYPLFISRKGINPLIDFITILNFLSIIIRLKPDCILTFSIKPVIYGSLVCRVLKVPCIAMITGLGTGFLLNNWVTSIIKRLYRVALRNVEVVFFQNEDDKEIFLQSRLVELSQCRMIPGSGVDLERFSYQELPRKKTAVLLLIARMLADKGVYEFVEAAKIVKKCCPHTEFQLLGPLGVENRTAVSNFQMQTWEDQGLITYLGETDNVASFIKGSTCVVLPSYREGTSRVLLEAAAMGRPIITTNVPGCREIVDHEVNGLLCLPRNAEDLAIKMQEMLSLTDSQREYMGILGRKKIENQYNQNIVFELYLNAIEEILTKKAKLQGAGLE